MEVRQIATSYTGPVAATGAFASTVATWDLTTKARLATFESVLDFGGRRLAVDEAGARCATAGYVTGGLVCSSAATGSVTWTRADLRRLQFVGFSCDGRRLFCGADERPCLVLDAATGHQLEVLRGVRRVWESFFTDAMLLDGARLKLTARAGRSIAPIERTSFGVLDATFGPELLCISESGGPVRCVDVAGREVWRYGPAPGRHVLKLAYTGEMGCFVGVEWPYEHGGTKVLRRFSATGGEPRTVAELGKPAEVAFFAAGTRLLTSEGHVWDTINGIRVGRLVFDGAVSVDDV